MVVRGWNTSSIRFVANLLKCALVVVNASLWNTLLILALLSGILAIAVDKTPWSTLARRLVAVGLRLNTIFAGLASSWDFAMTFHTLGVWRTIGIRSTWLDASRGFAYESACALIVFGTTRRTYFQIITADLTIRTLAVRLTKPEIVAFAAIGDTEHLLVPFDRNAAVAYIAP